MLKTLVISLILLISYCSMANEIECEEPLKLSLTSEWYPYIYQDDDGLSTGVDVELLRIVLKRMSCQLEVVHYPERRMLYELSSGPLDIGLGASKTASREKIFHYSKPYRHEVNKFAFRTNDNDIRQVKSLQDIMDLRKVIAINLSGWYGEEIDQAKRTYDFFVYSDTAFRRIKMLHFSRVDIVIDDEIVLCSDLDRFTYEQLVIHPMILSQAPIHFIFNKSSVSKNFVTVFNQVLSSMDKSGELSAHYINNLPSQCQIA